MKSTLAQREPNDHRLREDERQAMRESLMAYINKHPVPAGSAVKSTWLDYRYPSKWSQASRIIGTVLLFAVLGTGVAYAAGNTVPGDLLYPVKTEVNERVRGWVAFTTKQKAEVSIALAEKRLIEAEKLESQSRLNGAMRTKLSKDFQTHVQKASNDIKAMAKSNNIEAALTTNLNLVSTVDDHSRILNVLVSEIELPQAQAGAAATTSATTSIPNVINIP